MKKAYCVEEEKKENAKVKKGGKQQTKTLTDQNGSILFGGTINPELRAAIAREEKKIRPNIQDVEKMVLKSIVGQDRQVREIITTIYKSIEFNNLKSNILIIGGSGTGKTETVKQIVKILGIPYTIEDATKYTKEGYYGMDTTDMVFNLVDNANYNIQKAQKGIIVIDEIDKKTGYMQNDISGVEVLKSLLKIIEGTKIKMEVPKKGSYFGSVVDFDTKNITFILMGAFSGIEEIRDNRLNLKTIGFHMKEDDEKEMDFQDGYTKQDLIEYGIPEEFVGRIDNITVMNELTEENLSQILRKSKLSVFKEYQKELTKRGVTLKFDMKLFDAIAKKSMSLNTGARELTNTVNYIFFKIIFDVLANPGKYHQCVLDLDIVNDNRKYKLS